MGQGSSRRDEVPLDLPQQEVVSSGAGIVRGFAPHGGRPVAAQHDSVAQVKQPLIWEKNSFHVEREGSSKYNWKLSASFSSDVPCSLSVHFHCLEKAAGEGFDFVPAASDVPVAYRRQFPAGKHTVVLEGADGIDLKKWPLEVFWKYKKKQADVVPVVFALADEGGFQSVVHLGLDHVASGGSTAAMRCVLLAQKVFVGGRQYVLQDVYGLAELGRDDAADESAVGQPCVICLTDPRSTAVLPCRHLCVCEDCARQLQVGAAMRNEKCPICRNDISGMQVFDICRPSDGRAPAAT